jgi:hypothetical protein
MVVELLFPLVDNQRDSILFVKGITDIGESNIIDKQAKYEVRKIIVDKTEFFVGTIFLYILTL